MSDPELRNLLNKHRAFWNRAPADKPLLNVSFAEDSLFAALHGMSIPLADGTILSTQSGPMTPEIIDPRLILDVEEFPLRSRDARGASGPLTVGDLFVTRAPLGKIPWVEAVLGCPVIPRLDSGSVYSAPYLEGPDRWDTIPPPEESGWFKLLVEYTRLLAQESKGEYQVVQCLQRGPIDLASAVLGHTEMCYAVYDNPRALHALAEFCTQVFLKVAKAQEALIRPLEGGYCNPFGVWSPGTVVRTQCDVASSVRASTYEEFFFPYDREICKAFDYSVVHLHSGFLHHVDVLLKDKYPTAVQVSLDTGSTPFSVIDRIPVFRRILEEKPLFIMGEMSKPELEELLEKLPARGLCISPRAFDKGA
jgi:hypothetical protein